MGEPVKNGWAYKALGVTPGAPLNEVQRTFLKEIDTDPLPDDLKREALACLKEAEVPDAGRDPIRHRWPARRAERSRILSEKIERFQATFFKLAPDERKRRFERLMEKSSGDPVCTLMLERLQSGVEFSAEALDDASGTTRQLALDLLEVAKASGVTRGKATVALVRKFRLEPQRKHAFAQLKQKFPEVLGMAPEVLDALKPEKKLESKKRATSSSKGDSSWISWPALFLIFFLIRACTSLFTSTPPRSPTPVYNPRDFQLEIDRNNERVKELLKKLEVPDPPQFDKKTSKGDALATERGATPAIDDMTPALPPKNPPPPDRSLEGKEAPGNAADRP